MRDLLRIGARILRRSVSGDDTGDGFDDGFAISRESRRQGARIEAVAKVFVDIE